VARADVCAGFGPLVSRTRHHDLSIRKDQRRIADPDQVTSDASVQAAKKDG
jgi:hypothetical protein